MITSIEKHIEYIKTSAINKKNSCNYPFPNLDEEQLIAMDKIN